MFSKCHLWYWFEVQIVRELFLEMHENIIDSKCIRPNAIKYLMNRYLFELSEMRGPPFVRGWLRLNYGHPWDIWYFKIWTLSPSTSLSLVLLSQYPTFLCIFFLYFKTAKGRRLLPICRLPISYTSIHPTGASFYAGILRIYETRQRFHLDHHSMERFNHAG